VVEDFTEVAIVLVTRLDIEAVDFTGSRVVLFPVLEIGVRDFTAVDVVLDTVPDDAGILFVELVKDDERELIEDPCTEDDDMALLDAVDDPVTMVEEAGIAREVALGFVDKESELVDDTVTPIDAFVRLETLVREDLVD